MKHLIVFAMVIALAIPASALAQKKVDEYGDDVLNPDVVEQVAPTKAAAPQKGAAAKAVQEKDVGPGGPKAAAKKDAPATEKKVEPAPAPAPIPVSYGPSASGREKRFAVGFVGPGFAYFSRGYGPAMSFGFEGEYYFFERLSAGLRTDIGTKFKSPTILSIVPRVRYVFDLSNHPRWVIYGTAGVGVGLSIGGGTYAACDIAIPGGGFWWQWTEHLSIGADSTFHILARSQVAIGWTFGPELRYIF